MSILLWAATAYLLGSIPFGLLFVKVSGKGDIRHMGSGNIGTTNVLRTGHKGLALATLLADMGKGALAVLLPQLGSEGWASVGDGSFSPLLIYGFSAFIGHIFPVWLRFKGGKGVATAFGTILALHWPSGVIGLILWGIVAKVFKRSSLAALLSFPLICVSLYFFLGGPLFYYSIVVTFIIFMTHRDNIKRLYRKEESHLSL